MCSWAASSSSVNGRTWDRAHLKPRHAIQTVANVLLIATPGCQKALVGLFAAFVPRLQNQRGCPAGLFVCVQEEQVKSDNIVEYKRSGASDSRLDQLDVSPHLCLAAARINLRVAPPRRDTRSSVRFDWMSQIFMNLRNLSPRTHWLSRHW